MRFILRTSDRMAMLMIVFMIPITAILATFAYLAVQAIAEACCQARKHKIDAELKLALAQRGMSAAEIERVVAARAPRPGDELPLAAAAQTPGSPLPPRKETPRKATLRPEVASRGV